MLIIPRLCNPIYHTDIHKLRYWKGWMPDSRCCLGNKVSMNKRMLVTQVMIVLNVKMHLSFRSDLKNTYDMTLNTKPGTDSSNRLCFCCSNKTVKDEKHFIVQCPFHSDERKQLYEKVHLIKPSFVQMSNDEQFLYLFCSNDERIMAWFRTFFHSFFYLNVWSFRLCAHTFLICIR